MSRALPAAERRFTSSRIGRLLLAAVDVYAAGLLLYFVLRVFIGDSFWPVALVSNFLHWLLLPAFVLLPLALWQRQWIRAAIFGAHLAAFALLFGALFLPQSTAAAASTDTLTVMSYNIGDGRADPERLAEVLRASDADVIALLELAEEQAAALEAVRDLYPYQVSYPEGIPGKGLLSRYPILEEEVFSLYTGRLHLWATLDIDGRTLTLIAAHAPNPTITNGNPYYIHPRTGEDIASLADMAASGGPTLLVGDFNATDQSDRYTLLTRAGLIDAFRAVGWGFGVTWPMSIGNYPILPLVRIDYVWTTPDFQVMRAWVGADAGSDHLPVLAELSWPM